MVDLIYHIIKTGLVAFAVIVLGKHILMEPVAGFTFVMIVLVLGIALITGLHKLTNDLSQTGNGS